MRGLLVWILLEEIEESVQYQETLYKLTENEALWRFLGHLAEDNEFDRFLQKELMALLEDTEIHRFLRQNVEAVIEWLATVRAAPETEAEPEQEKTEEQTGKSTGEEETP